jgi:hypothetical protein
MNRAQISQLSLTVARGLTIFYALGLSCFAIDVFQAGHAIVPVAIEFIIHVSPSLLLFFLLAITWKRPTMAAIVFLGAAVLFTLFFHTYRSVMQFGLLTAPLLFPAMLFYLASRKPRPEAS